MLWPTSTGGSGSTGAVAHWLGRVLYSTDTQFSSSIVGPTSMAGLHVECGACCIGFQSNPTTHPTNKDGRTTENKYEASFCVVRSVASASSARVVASAAVAAVMQVVG